MKDMLEKVTELQSGSQNPRSVEDERVKELERQVASLTEQRIQHLEKLQEHQVDMQVNLCKLFYSFCLNSHKSYCYHLLSVIVFCPFATLSHFSLLF